METVDIEDIADEFGLSVRELWWWMRRNGFGHLAKSRITEVSQRVYARMCGRLEESLTVAARSEWDTNMRLTGMNDDE